MVHSWCTMYGSYFHWEMMIPFCLTGFHGDEGGGMECGAGHAFAHIQPKCLIHCPLLLLHAIQALIWQ